MAKKNTSKPVRVYNARRDTLDFRDRMYVASLTEVPSDIPLDSYLSHQVPVLDQGKEGACTGFGLATVANYLLIKRSHVPDRTPVSPRMLYELARRYDEWPGTEYSGSSARGAMKGWNKHGVCAATDWPYDANEKKQFGLNEKRTAAAKARPLGSYYRVNHKDLIAMHAALADVGVLYATALVHDGWQDVGADGAITFSDHKLGGHAFAIVAYDAHGFWVQNSWGPSWGKGGMGHICYDDWLANGTDVWVARLGAPVILNKPMSFATAHASTSGQSQAYTFADLRPHIISLENEGRLTAGGDYGNTPSEVATIFNEDIPRLLDQAKPRRLLLFAHGGLVSAEAAAQRVAEYRGALLAEGVYPLAMIWHTDYWSTITNMLQDAVRRRRPEGVLDKTKDFLLDRLDDMLEPIARSLTGKAAWSEMKENAIGASNKEGGLRLVLDHIIALKNKWPDLEIHIVAHSAGSILFAPLIQLLTGADKITTGPMRGSRGAGLKVKTCTLWAPAITAELFKETYLPEIGKGIGQFAMYSLTDAAEQDDNCARIYNKSLLYLVSNAFERERRIPGFKEGTPILGMERTVVGDKADKELRALFKKGVADLVMSPNKEAEGSLSASRAQHHGDFDDDKFTVASTFARILGAKVPFDISTLDFARSANSLTQRRMAIDDQTKR